MLAQTESKSETQPNFVNYSGGPCAVVRRCRVAVWLWGQVVRDRFGQEYIHTFKYALRKLPRAPRARPEPQSGCAERKRTHTIIPSPRTEARAPKGLLSQRVTSCTLRSRQEKVTMRRLRTTPYSGR